MFLKKLHIRSSLGLFSLTEEMGEILIYGGEIYWPVVEKTYNSPLYIII